MRFLSSPGSCSFEVMPGTLRNICLSVSVGLPGRICQQLCWHIHNVLVCPGQFFVLVVQALAFEAIFGGLCQVCV